MQYCVKVLRILLAKKSVLHQYFSKSFKAFLWTLPAFLKIIFSPDLVHQHFQRNIVLIVEPLNSVQVSSVPFYLYIAKSQQSP